MVLLDDISTPSKASKIKVADLKSKLEEYGLDTSGVKADLVERLKAHLEAAAESAPGIGVTEEEEAAAAAAAAPSAPSRSFGSGGYANAKAEDCALASSAFLS
mmetsp:Transcript_2752/g.4658  ORF Transcript_2752/g.4658 Transcript_2752/m.4658 type:complete len:103 (-) Transcript_2752:101-409(-)